MYETKVYDICHLQKRLMQTWVNFEQNIIKAAIDQWPVCDHVCMLVADTLNTWCEIIVYWYYVIITYSFITELSHATQRSD